MKLKGRRPKQLDNYYANCPYKVGEWVLVHTGKQQIVGRVINASNLICTVEFYKNEVWTEVESALERIEVTSVEHPVPVSSISCTIPEEVAKNLLLLQGVEL